MDALSRLLASVGRSLGEGLQRVGETELQKQQQADAIRTQAFEQLRVKLFEEYLKAAGNPGFAALTPEEQKQFQQTLALLSIPGGKLDENAYAAAVNLLARVNQQGGLIGTLKTLIERGSLGEAGALLVDMDEEEARRLLRLLGSEGLYSSLITQGKHHRELQALGLRRDQVQYQMLLSQLEHFENIRPLLIDQLRAQINELIEKTRGQELQNRKLREELERLPQLLDAAVREALAKAAMSEEDARRYPEYLEAKIRELGARIGLTEAQIQQVLASVDLTRAQTEQVMAETEGVQLRNFRQRMENELMELFGYDQARAKTISEYLDVFQKAGITDPEVIARRLTSVVGSEEEARRIAASVAQVNERLRRQLEAETLAKELKVSVDRLSLANTYAQMFGSDPSSTDEEVLAALKVAGIPEQLHPLVLSKARWLRTLARYDYLKEITKTIAEMPLPRTEDDMSRMLGPVWEAIVENERGALGEEGARRLANGFINSLKEDMRHARRVADLQLRGEEAKIRETEARAAEAEMRTRHIPLQHTLDQRKVAVAEGQLAVAWANQRLQERIFGLNQQQFTWGQLKDLLEIAGSFAALTGLPDADTFKKEVDTLNKLYDAGMRALAAAAPGCINNNVIPGTNTIFGLALGLSEECRQRVERALDKEVIKVQDENGEVKSLTLRQVFDQVDQLYAITVSRASSYLGMAGAAASGGIGAVPFVFNPTYQSIYNRMLQMAGLPPVDFNQLFYPPEITPPQTPGRTAPPPPGTTAPPPPGTSGAGAGGGTPGTVQGVSIARQYLAPQSVRSALPKLGGIGGEVFTPELSVGLGYAAMVLPGEGGGPDNPIQLKHSSYERLRTECQRKSGNDPAANAICQGVGLAKDKNITRNPNAWHAAAVGLSHMFPAAVGMNPTAPLVSNRNITPDLVENQPAVLRFASAARGRPVGANDATPADVGAYYAYNALHAWRDVIGLSNASPDSFVLYSYALAFLPVGRQQDRNTLRNAVSRAYQFLGGTRSLREEELNRLADTLGFIASRLNAGYMGRALASRATAGQGTNRGR